MTSTTVAVFASALSCRGATARVTSAADGWRTTIFRKDFSTDSACHESLSGAFAHWQSTEGSTQGTDVRTSARQPRQTLPLRLQGSRHESTAPPATALPNLCREAGLNSEEEVVIRELRETAHDGTLKEARGRDLERWFYRRAHRHWKVRDSSCSGGRRRRLQVLRSTSSSAGTKAMYALLSLHWYHLEAQLRLCGCVGGKSPDV